MPPFVFPRWYCHTPSDSSIPFRMTTQKRKSHHLIFLPGFIPLSDKVSPFKPGTLPFATHLLLLQTYPSVAIAWRIIGGSHTLPIADFCTATNAQLFAPTRTNAGLRVSARAGALQSPSSAWTCIVMSMPVLQTPDEHTPDCLWPTLPGAGECACQGTFLPGRRAMRGRGSGCRWRESRGLMGHCLCGLLGSRSISKRRQRGRLLG